MLLLSKYWAGHCLRLVLVMPDLKDLLAKAKTHEANKSKKKLTRGARPDLIISEAAQKADEPDQSKDVIKAPVIETSNPVPPPSNHSQKREVEGTTASIQMQVEEGHQKITPSSASQKVASNLDQSSTKEASNLDQTGNKLASNLDQISIRKKTGLGKSSIKVRPKLAPQLISKLNQTGIKVASKASLETIVGLQRSALFFIYESCRISGSKISPPIAITNLAVAVKTTVAAARIAIQRIEKKGFVRRAEYKDGRGGWTKYELPDEIYSQLVFSGSSIKVASNLDQSYTKLAPELAPELAPTAPCSSSDLNIINNTTTTEPDFWLSVPKNLDGLVSVKQLREFVRVGLVTDETLQTSLDGFSFDLERGFIKAKNGNPIAILIGAIKAGGYISQQYLTELKSSLVEIEKAREELHKLEAKNLAEKLRVEFEAFKEKYPVEAEKLKPSGKFLNTFQPGSVGYRLWLDEFKRSREVISSGISDATNP